MLGCKQESSVAKTPVTGKDMTVLASSVILAISYDVLIAQPFVALSYPVFIFTLLLVVYRNTWRLLGKELNIAWFLVFPIIALSLTRFLFANEILRLLNSIVVPILLVAHILLVTRNSRYEWFCFDFLKDICGGLIVRPLQFVTKPFLLMRGLARMEGEIANLSVTRKVLFGVVLSVPILIVVVLLLSSADEVFNFVISSVIANISFDEVARHSLVIGFVTLLSFSFIWGLNNNRADQVLHNGGTKKLDDIIVISGLCVLSAVYLLFSVIQFTYLFGGFSNLLPFGLTYADYARSGFFELVVVSLINIGLVVGNINITIRTSRWSAIALKWLNSILLLSTFVMLFSAHYRMSLYEESFGYTYLRVFTHSFMIMLFIMLCATVYKVWVEKINLAKWYVMIGLMAYVLINYTNVDTFIAQKNMQRYYRSGVIDVDYMASLSYDALPYWVALLEASDQRVEHTARQHIAQKQGQLSTTKSWQGFNLAEQRARDILRKIPQT